MKNEDGDGVALLATAHPVPPLRERLYWRWVIFWRWQILYRVCWWKRPYETVEIEIDKDAGPFLRIRPQRSEKNEA